MGYSQQTANYHLPQYVADDRPSYLGDWNEAMGNIDIAMKSNDTAIKNNEIAVANMKKYVDTSVAESKTYVDGEIVKNKQYTDTALATKISKADADLDYVKNYHKMLVVGDSFLNMPGDWGSSLATRISAEQQARGGCAVVMTKSNMGGCGFVCVSGTSNFQTLTQDALQANTGAAFDLIVIAGGVNDAPGDGSMGAAMANIESIITTYNKGVRPDVYVFPNIWCYKPAYGRQFEDNAISIMRSVNFSHVHLGAWTWIYDTKAADGFVNSDSIHPSAKGGRLIATNMYACMKGMNPNVNQVSINYDKVTVTRNYLTIMYSAISYTAATDHVWIQEKYIPDNVICVGANPDNSMFSMSPDAEYDSLKPASGTATKGMFTYVAPMIYR